MSRSLTKDCGVCQTRWASSDCVVIGGQGSTDDPYIAEFDIDESVEHNILEQGPNGAAAFVPPRFLNLPAVHLYSSIEQVMAWDTVQGLEFNESRFNTDNMSSDDDKGIIVINTPGVYLVTFNARWKKTRDDSATGDLAAFLLKNGSDYIAIDSMPVPSGDSFAKHSLSKQLNLEAGDFVSALLKQDVIDGDDEKMNLTCTVERMSPIFSAIYLRDAAIELCA